MNEAYQNGLAQVYEILKYVDEESLNMIPQSFMDFIKENKSDYSFKIDLKFSLLEQDLLYEAKVIMSVIYRDYWASKEERDAIIKEDRIRLNKIEEEKSKEYNYEELFTKNKDSFSNTIIDDSKIAPIVVKENFFKKILNKIKKFFKKIGVK